MGAAVAIIVKALSALAQIVPASVELFRNWRMFKNEAEERRQRDVVRDAIERANRVPVVSAPPSAGADAGRGDGAPKSP